jgi:hypothetical protein
LLSFQVWRVFLVGPRGVLLQPVFEEAKNLHGHGRAASVEIGLERQDLFGESLVFRLMRGQIGVVVQEHQALRMGEMDGGVSHQPVQDSGE